MQVLELYPGPLQGKQKLTTEPCWALELNNISEKKKKKE